MALSLVQKQNASSQSLKRLYRYQHPWVFDTIIDVIKEQELELREQWLLHTVVLI